MATTLTQMKAVAIAPKFTALPSAIASTINVALILRRGKNNRKAYHRLVLGMSACNFLASTAWFCTTWPIPSETPGTYGAVGNQQTCSAQAFFAQSSLSTVVYNGSLALYYYLVIVRGWHDDQIARVEPFLHAHAVAWGLGTALASLALGLFNQVGWDCWISPAPLGCQESWNAPPGVAGTCARGDNGSLYQWAFYYAPLWFVILLVAGLMYAVYHDVLSQEQRLARAAANSSGRDVSMTQTKRVAHQAALYVGAMLVAWLFPTIFQLVIVTTGALPFPLLFLTALFIPIQGLLNLFVFTHSAFVGYRQDHPGPSLLTAWFGMLKQELNKDWG